MLHHIMLIDERIRGREYPNASTLARDLELAVRTIGRKIEFMRDVLDAPIEYDATRRGYYYSQRNWSLPSMRVTEGELLGLALAQLALGAYKGTPLEGYLKRVADKIAAALPDTVDLEPADLSDRFRFALGPVAPFDPQIWEQLAKATREGRTVEMRYHTLTNDKVTDRKVDPYFLRCYRGDWYLIGYDHKSGNIPMFSLGRIRKLKPTRRHFDMADDFDADAYLGGTFGVFVRQERHRVRIRFTGVAARYIQERSWHPSQKLTRKSDGSVVLEMRLADIEEVGRWVLTWGSEAKVLGPKELVAHVRDVAREVAGVYEGDRKQRRRTKDAKSMSACGHTVHQGTGQQAPSPDGDTVLVSQPGERQGGGDGKERVDA